MNTKALAQNTALQIGAKGLATIIGLVTVALLTRYLGADGYGKFTIILSFVSIFAVLVDFGLTLTTTQMISEEGADETSLIANLLSLRVISATLFLALAPLTAWLFPYESVVQIGIAIGAASYLFGTTSQMLGGLFQKRLIIGRFMLAELVTRVTLLIGVLLAPLAQLELTDLLWVMVIGNALQLATILLFARQFITLRLRINLATWKMIVKRSWPIGASIFFNLIYLRGDILFLSVFREDAETGLYGAAYKIIDVITMIPVMYMGLILPMLVLAWSQQNREQFQTMLQQTWDFFALVAWPVALGSIVVAGPLMALIAGPDFFDAGRALWFLGPAASIVFFNSLFGHLIVAVNKQKSMVLGYAAVAMITIAGYLWHIPTYGMMAAAWWTLIAETLITALTCYFVWRTSKFSLSWKLFGKSAVAASVMAGMILLLPSWSVLAHISLGALVYICLIALMKGPTPKDVIRLLRV